jgi:hypothetical protein
MSNLKRHLAPLLRDSSFKMDKERLEILSIVAKVLDEHYNKDVIIESLLHKATFDREVFHRYFRQRTRESNIGCWPRKHDEAKAIGFDTNSIFGSELVMLVEFFIENQPK